MAAWMVGVIICLVIFFIAWGKNGSLTTPASSGWRVDDYPSQQSAELDTRRRSFSEVVNDPLTWIRISALAGVVCAFGIWASSGYPLPNLRRPEF